MSASKMEAYEQCLLDAGFLRARDQDLSGVSGHFYKVTGNSTAFVVNLKERNEGITMIYGHTSTAYMKSWNEKSPLQKYGVDSGSITLRKRFFIEAGDESDDWEKALNDMYRAYEGLKKEALFKVLKKKRIVFLDQVARHLRRLGFKEKGKRWKRYLTDRVFVYFKMVAADFSDAYYMIVGIDVEQKEGCGQCFYKRISHKELCPLDWQLYAEEEFSRLFEKEVLDLLRHIIQTPLNMLGKEELICRGCACDLYDCEDCFVEENMSGGEEEIWLYN